MKSIETIIRNLRVAMTDARQNESHFESWMILNEAICDAIDALAERPAKQQQQQQQECNHCGGTGDVSGEYPGVACSECSGSGVQVKPEFFTHSVEQPYDWSDWVCPDPKSYLMKCCDCGLVHEAQFGVVRYKSETEREDCDMVDDPNLQAVFRMRRSEQWSPEDTAYRPGGLPQEEQPAQQKTEFVSPGGGYVPAIPRPLPIDWKLVPRKATPEMLKAMDECAQEGYDERLYEGMASSVYMAAWDASPMLGTLPPSEKEKSMMLAEQKAEQPVAWMYDVARYGPSDVRGQQWRPAISRIKPHIHDLLVRDIIPLYTSTPSPKPWVGLTQHDINVAFDDTQEGGGFDEFARAIEAKLREKNA